MANKIMFDLDTADYVYAHNDTDGKVDGVSIEKWDTTTKVTITSYNIKRYMGYSKELV